MSVMQYRSDPTTAETPTMRERLARNMARRYFSAEEPPFPGSEDQFVEFHWPAFAEELDAILREMLEPSEGMLSDGLPMIPDWDPERENLFNAWQAMIHHILNETQD